MSAGMSWGAIRKARRRRVDQSARAGQDLVRLRLCVGSLQARSPAPLGLLHAADFVRGAPGGALLINGLWLEDPALAEDPQFVPALTRGLQRFRQFLNAQVIDLSAAKAAQAEARLVRQLQQQLA